MKTACGDPDWLTKQGAIQVLLNAIFLEIGPPPAPLVKLITLKITPSLSFFPENLTPPTPICVT